MNGNNNGIIQKVFRKRYEELASIPDIADFPLLLKLRDAVLEGERKLEVELIKEIKKQTRSQCLMCPDMLKIIIGDTQD